MKKEFDICTQFVEVLENLGVAFREYWNEDINK
jgi:hypothetical protein